VGIAAYATGEDYHLVLRQRLQQWVIPRLETLFPRERFRTVTDSAPLLERAFAVRAGLGFIGKNTLHIMPGAGSFHFLAAVVTTAHLPRTPLSRTMPDCGQCTRCLDACPTQAFVSPFVLDARRCISYLTIERKQAMTPEEQQPLRGLVFGCDICQQVCPYNKAPAPTLIEEFLEGRTVHREEPASTFPPHLSHRQLRKRFPGSPLLRAGRRLLLHVQGTRQPSKESPPTSG
jgi:epoxyqueuosine reductase